MGRPVKALSEVPVDFCSLLKKEGFSDLEICLLNLVSKVFPLNYLRTISETESTLEVPPQILCRNTLMKLSQCYAAADILERKGILHKSTTLRAGKRQPVYYSFVVDKLVSLISLKECK